MRKSGFGKRALVSIGWAAFAILVGCSDGGEASEDASAVGTAGAVTGTPFDSVGGGVPEFDGGNSNALDDGQAGGLDSGNEPDGDVSVAPDVSPDVFVDPCGADGECNPACGGDPDCDPDPDPDPDPCEADGVCNDTDCPVGGDPDCEVEAEPSCEADGACAPECWDTDPDCGCAALGISSHWEGTFEGVIPYEFIGGIGGSGDEDADGSLAFDIDCLAAKYIVQGEMSGTEESGVPFSVMLSGFYDPFTETLTAQMVDGVVTLLPGIAEITFEGDFNGTLINGDHFEGNWSGESTGGAGGILTATGSGTWEAYGQ